MMLEMNWSKLFIKPSVQRLMMFVAMAIVLVFSTPIKVLASDEPEVYDARLQGYTQTVQLDIASTALIWLLLIVLGALCLGVLFKDAKRSHLD
jgi:hypothetical protein